MDFGLREKLKNLITTTKENNIEIFFFHFLKTEKKILQGRTANKIMKMKF